MWEGKRSEGTKNWKENKQKESNTEGSQNGAVCLRVADERCQQTTECRPAPCREVRHNEGS